jgi:hypothetical protein
VSRFPTLVVAVVEGFGAVARVARRVWVVGVPDPALGPLETESKTDFPDTDFPSSQFFTSFPLTPTPADPDSRWRRLVNRRRTHAREDLPAQLLKVRHVARAAERCKNTAAAN